MTIDPRILRAFEADNARSPLPPRPDETAANTLLMDIHLRVLRLKNGT